MAPPALLAAYFGSPYFDLIVALCAVVMAWEWDKISTGKFGRSGVVLAILAALAALTGATYAVPAALVVMSVSWVLFLLERSRAPWASVGALYLGLPIIALVWLRSGVSHGRESLFLLMFSVWATDIGAYAAGRLIGGPKLAPAISPNKTWAGLLGGMVSSMLICAVAALLLHLPIPLFLGVGALLAVVAQAGDLWESWVKRHFGVKDSSAIIPGHGGVLDRVDGLLAAAVAVAILNMIYGGGVLSWQ